MEITIETHEIKIIRVGGVRQTAFCRSCRRDAGILSLVQFAASFRISADEVCRQIETGEIHLTSNGRGAALICCNSLGGFTK